VRKQYNSQIQQNYDVQQYYETTSSSIHQ